MYFTRGDGPLSLTSHVTDIECHRRKRSVQESSAGDDDERVIAPIDDRRLRRVAVPRPIDDHTCSRTASSKTARHVPVKEGMDARAEDELSLVSRLDIHQAATVVKPVSRGARPHVVRAMPTPRRRAEPAADRTRSTPLLPHT